MEEIDSQSKTNNPDAELTLTIQKFASFSRVTGYLYLILAIIPITIISLITFFLRNKTVDISPSPDISINNFHQEAFNNFLEPYVPLIILGFFAFIILNIGLIFFSNKIIKNNYRQIVKNLNAIAIISILILIIFLPSIVIGVGLLSVLIIKIIFDIFEIKKSIKT